MAKALGAGADANAPDKEGQTPLMLAAGHNNSAVVTELLEAGAERHFVDDENKDALQHAEAAARIRRNRAVLMPDPAQFIAEGERIVEFLRTTPDEGPGRQPEPVGLCRPVPRR